MPASPLVLVLQTAARGIDKAVSRACGLLLGTMTLAVLVGVFFRYVLLRPLGWTEELARYLMIWTASLAICVGIYHGEHIGLTFIPDRVKSRTGSLLLGLLINFLVLVFLVVMIYFSLILVKDAKFQIAQSLPISMVIPSLAIPFCMGLALLQLVIKTCLLFFGEDFQIQEKARLDI
jgi:TRAP-type C4-dicarboxylate transport system permease small subunit